jgi:cytochrome P450
MSTAEPIFDPRLPEFHANPYPFYRALREKDPVHQSPLGFWVLTRYDDVVTSLRDPRFGCDGFAPLLETVYGAESAPGNLPRSMLMRDPPGHTRLRALVNKAFTSRSSTECVLTYRPSWTGSSIASRERPGDGRHCRSGVSAAR